MPLPPIIDDSKGPKDPIDLAAAEAASGAIRVPAEDAGHAAVGQLNLAGFCPVTFVKRAGLLLRADTAQGFIRVVWPALLPAHAAIRCKYACHLINARTIHRHAAAYM